jgi:hypothetical protein
MGGEDFVRDIEAFRDERLWWLADPSPETSPPAGGIRGLLEVALAGNHRLRSGVNESFMALCAALGDSETVKIYRDFIQPDERTHQRMGRERLARHAVSSETRSRVRKVVGRTLDLAASGRAGMAEKLGTRRFLGC